MVDKKTNIDVTARVIPKSLPNERIFQFDECVDYVSKKNNLDGKLVAKALVKSIGKKGVRAVNNEYGVFVQKNEH